MARPSTPSAGGAIWAEASSVAVDHSLLFLNKADGDTALGGGIYNEGDDSTLTHSLVFANQATTDGGEALGGGVFNAGTIVVDKANIKFNKATIGDDNVSGDLTPLDKAFATML